MDTQGEILDGSKYVQNEDERTRGAPKLHSLETSKNAQKSEQERTKVWWTHESLDMNARKSAHERTKVWTWTHESLHMNARKSAHERTKVCTWTHESLHMNARKSGERTKIWTWTHESLHMNARKSGERTKIWTWTHQTKQLSINPRNNRELKTNGYKLKTAFKTNANFIIRTRRSFKIQS